MNWLKTLQEKQLQDFLDRGLPTRREERWKYTDVSTLSFPRRRESIPASHENNNSERLFAIDSRLRGNDSINIVFIDGLFSSGYSNLKNLPSEVTACSIHEALPRLQSYLSKELDVQRYPFAVLNTAHLNDGLFLHIPKNCVLKTPIHCLYLSTENNFSSHLRNIVVADANSQCVLIEEYTAQAQEYFTNTVTQIFLNENAQLHYYKIQDESMAANHIANIIVEQKKDSRLKSFSLAKGALLAREDFHVKLQEPGAFCSLLGLYHLTENKQHMDNHLYVDHLSENGTSSMLYKGILDKKSHAVFNGKVYVEKGAQKTNAYQANHNLLLSNDAQIDTKPELEIYAEDVKCAHGATIGQLDSESLFYLCSRGIEKNAAKKLLTHAFAEEIIGKIEHPNIMQYIQQRVKQHEEY